VLLASCAASAGAAQLYRSVDANGRVEWRDTPPSDARQVEERRVQGNVMSTSGLPYAVQRAARNFPVTLWTAKCGEPCDAAKKHLVRRGIPYAERDARAESDQLRKLTGGAEVPVLAVGRTQIKGYSRGEWDNALDAVGYPSVAAADAP
jgi:glutaredoxin